jgi:predicted regulator of Ras-like GTPase activity (Roadblock/LC7/MglB family)
VKRYASPNEIVSRAAALDGVAGVLIALPDGLMVASRIPSELNGDTLAAFLPADFCKGQRLHQGIADGRFEQCQFHGRQRAVENLPRERDLLRGVRHGGATHADGAVGGLGGGTRSEK